MLKLSKLERHGDPTIRAGPTYRWNPRGLHVPTAGLNTYPLVSPSVNFFQGAEGARDPEIMLVKKSAFFSSGQCSLLISSAYWTRIDTAWSLLLLLSK
jgi:hypothetical protein